jgi:transcriptional regulator of acetoin/glycerol metabolism
VTSDEVVAGAVCVGAPVRDASGQIVAALSISAPSMRMRPPRPRALVTLVIDAAEQLSRALGAARPAEAAPAEGTKMPNGQWAMRRPSDTSRGHSIFR